MLDGVTPFPAEFAALYRALGYWADRPLFDGFTAALAAHADRIAVVDEARKDGYTQTVLGRRRYLPDLTSDNRQRREMDERMALNAPIQGSAADIIKVAMLRVDEALRTEDLRSRMLLQVHDELLLEAPAEEVDDLVVLLRERMGAAEALKVPLDVDVKVGDNWGDMTPVARS